jgi:hypothetical protein
MDEEADLESVYFVDGCVVRRGYVYIASKLHSLDPEEYDFSRMSLFRDGQWLKHDLEWDVESVCCWKPEPATLCALSMQGDVSIGTPKGFSYEKIPDAGTYEGIGATTQIRAIGETLYVCGYHGQVYRRQGRRWVSVDASLLEEEELDFHGLDGSSEEDIYAVAMAGRIFHWNGQGWHEVKSPTKANLERVRCVSPKEVYICGDGGTLLRGNHRDGFKVLSSKGSDLWGLEVFLGRVYAAAREGLFVLDGSELRALSTGLDPEIDGYRLDARDGVLWSFGVNDLAYFDGKTWTRVQHPDNPAR